MNASKEDLLNVLNEQKKTIEKYSNKLRDIVAAHKSLIIEKKALEDTIKILNASQNKDTNLPAFNVNDECNKDSSNKEDKEEQGQINSLLTSISNLISEKSQMEENFKVSQKLLMEDKKIIESKCKELEEEVKILTRQINNCENRSQSDFFFLKKDSKKQAKGGLQSTRKRNEKDGKVENFNSEHLTFQVKSYEKEIKNLRSELDAKRMIQEISEKKLKDYSIELSKLQEEVRNIQIEHQVALKLEKEKAKNVEDHAKKLSAIQEERVVNLETRLAELSETIGSYDRLRLQDQAEIQGLKEHIALMDIGLKGNNIQNQSLDFNCDSYDNCVEKINEFKKQLQAMAIEFGREDDYKKLFPDYINTEASHYLCKEEYNKLKAEYELLKNKIKIYSPEIQSTKEVMVLQNQIKNLQEKAKVLSDQNKIIEKEWQLQVEQLKKTIKNEKERYKETLSAAELDFRGRVWLLEEQLQKQRERSLALLEEKEQEIQSLQSTFQLLLPGNQKSDTSSDELKALPSPMIDGPHIVHYTNELARKDIEITNLRKIKNQIEQSNRDLQKEMVSIMEKQKEEKEFLRAEIARLKRCQSREGANLEYLKNVVYSFLLSSDPKSKRHMCNAIAAVLKFSDSEIQKVIDHSRNKWWTNSKYM